MKLNLSELLDVATFEGDILIRIWDDSTDDYSFEKYLDDFQGRDSWVYSHTVKYVYPLADIPRGRRRVAVVVIELAQED